MARSRTTYIILTAVVLACCFNFFRVGSTEGVIKLKTYVVSYPERSVAVKIAASNAIELLQKAKRKASPTAEEVIVSYNETIHGRSFRIEVDDLTFPDIPIGGPLEVIYENRLRDKVHRLPEFDSGIENDHIKEKYNSKEWKGYPLQHDDRDVTERVTPMTAEQIASGCKTKIRKYHTITTSVGSIYDTWIMRVSYHWWKIQKEKDICSNMGGFTRLLHSGQPDDYMNEIPSIVVPRLDADRKCNTTGDVKCDLGFIVLNRPYAMSVLLNLIETQKFFIAEKWILLLEPDHLILKPPAAIPRATYAFTYMFAPEDSNAEHAMKDWLPKGFSATKLPPGGPSPCLLHIDDWKKITPHWLEVSFQMQREYRFQQLFGWVLEMWGFLVAAVHVGIELNAHQFQIEPCAVTGWTCPKSVIDQGHDFDERLNSWKTYSQVPPFMMHVTQAMDFRYSGVVGHEEGNPHNPPWSFNKRHYTGLYPPRKLSPPPDIPYVFPGLVVEMINHASNNISTWGVLPGIAEGTFGRNTCREALECKNFKPTTYLKTLKVGPE